VTESVAQAWESFALIAFAHAGFVTALSDLVQVWGPLPVRQRFSFNPARLLLLFVAGNLPSLREDVRNFFGPRLASAEFTSCRLLQFV
jgi:hypothetical protein